MIDLSGKVALVTGAAAGIGRASAAALARAGAHVVVSDVDDDGGQRTVEFIERSGGAALFIRADVSSAADIEELFASIAARFGRLDCAHNNAGVENAQARIAESTEVDWDRSLAINLTGVWRCMRAELRQMQTQGFGVIVNTSSVGGVSAVPEGASYSAAKHGVIGLTRTAAVDYAAFNIRVNAICPGLTKTAMTARLKSEHPELLRRLLPPLGRMAEPIEIAGTVAFLCSELASFITGQAICIDGGATAL